METTTGPTSFRVTAFHRDQEKPLRHRLCGNASEVTQAVQAMLSTSAYVLVDNLTVLNVGDGNQAEC